LNLENSRIIDMYKTMLRIRKFEEKAIIEKKFGEEESQSFIVLTPKK